MLKGFWRCIYYWPMCHAAISGAAAINFCAQAADLVMVASLPSTRNGRTFHVRQKNTMVLAYFIQMPPDASRCPQMPPDASRCLQMPPDISQMPSRCPPDASRCLPDASQMPPRCLQMPPDASRCLQMRCLQIPPDASRCLRMFPDASRCLPDAYTYTDVFSQSELCW